MHRERNGGPGTPGAADGRGEKNEDGEKRGLRKMKNWATAEKSTVCKIESPSWFRKEYIKK